MKTLPLKKVLKCCASLSCSCAYPIVLSPSLMQVLCLSLCWSCPHPLCRSCAHPYPGLVLEILAVKVFLLRFTHYLQLSPDGYYGPGIAASHSTWMNDGGKTKERARNQKLLDLIFRSDHELLWPGSHPVLAYWFRTGSHRRFLRCLVILNIHN